MSVRRFVEAQDPVYEAAVAELEAGRKRGHWMWFVFPQIAGLGSSATSRRYAISSLAEANEYLAHPVLGPRLEQCCDALLALDGPLSAEQILGPVDALKLHSSMTLFAHAVSGRSIFERVLDRFYGGVKDVRTEALVTRSST